MQRIFGRSRVGLVSSFTLSRRWASNSGTDGSSSSSSNNNNNNNKKDGKHTTTTPTQSKRGAAFATTTDSTPPSHPLHAPESVYAHSDLTKDLRAPRAEVHSKFNQQQQKVPTQESGVRRTATKPIILRAAASADAAGTNNKSDGASSSSTPSSPPTSSISSSSPSPSAVAERVPGAKQVVRTQDGPTVPDYGPLRATGLWSVDEVVDEQRSTVEFRRIDDIETDIAEQLREPDEALVPYAEEERWKHQLMFVHKFFKTPKHMTWKELGEEIQCLDCVINLDEHRPEEIFTINFFFTDKATGQRDVLWSARNDVSYSEGFTDLLAAVGACLGRSDVHRTIRFDDGHGTLRDVTIRKRSRYTSDITLAFRPPESYDKYRRKVEQDEYESSMEAEGLSTWGFHPQMMDPEYNDLDFQDPEGTYTVAISAHGFSFLFLRAIKRLLSRPMEEYYRPSQRMRTAKVRTTDDIGFAHAMKGWMGIEDQIYPHFTPIEALQDHWLGKDAPFTLCSIINKLREMAYLKKENPELQSWLSVRHHDTHAAIRNLGVKMLGVGASTLFIPSSHNPTVNRLLPRHQQRRLESRFSINAVLGLPDETRRLEEFKRLTGSPSSLMDSAANNNNTTDEKVMEEVRASSGSTDKTHNTDVKQS